MFYTRLLMNDSVSSLLISETLSVVGVEEGNADSCKIVGGGSLWGTFDAVSLTFER